MTDNTPPSHEESIVYAPPVQPAATFGESNPVKVGRPWLGAWLTLGFLILGAAVTAATIVVPLIVGIGDLFLGVPYGAIIVSVGAHRRVLARQGRLPGEMDPRAYLFRHYSQTASLVLNSALTFVWVLFAASWLINTTGFGTRFFGNITDLGDPIGMFGIGGIGFIALGGVLACVLNTTWLTKSGVVLGETAALAQGGSQNGLIRFARVIGWVNPILYIGSIGIVVLAFLVGIRS